MSLNFGGTTSSLFGNSKPAFGLSVTTSTPTQTNQKGSSAPNTATPGQGAGTGLFGSTTTPSEPNKRPMFGSSTTSGSGLFGTPSTTGGLFGNNAATSAAGSTGSGLFGTTATSTAGNASSGGLFGNTSGNALGGFTTGFGSTAPKTDSTTGGFGLFGSSSSAVPTTSTGLTAAGTLGGSGTTQTSSQQDQETRQEFDQICQQLMFIKECWDPASPNCQFRHYFYNVVDPSQVQLYQCPPNQDPVLWQLAQRDNPDPSRLVPALASSFKDLKERSDEQKRQLTAYQATADIITKKLESLMHRHHNSTLVKLAEARRRQVDLTQRLLEFMTTLQILRLRGQMLRPEEEMLRVRIEQIDRILNSNDSLQQCLSDLQNKVYRLQARSRQRASGIGGGGGGGTTTQDPELESQLNPIINALADQQKATAYLTETTHKYLDSVAKIEQGLADRRAEVSRPIY